MVETLNSRDSGLRRLTRRQSAPYSAHMEPFGDLRDNLGSIATSAFRHFKAQPGSAATEARGSHQKGRHF
jgi:hypothetical protein